MESQNFIMNEDFENKIIFDASEIVQSWFMDETSNQGLRIECDLCHEFGIQFTNEDINLSINVESTDNQRDMTRRATLKGDWTSLDKKVDCPSIQHKRKPRCCRESMIVDFSKISGFEFIQQPKAFDAYMCRGRCPARYNALNDHSLLQSIMHLKTKKHSNSKNRVHKPCCVGTKFQPLDILHVDDKNPSKLKVTHWKNVI